MTTQPKKNKLMKLDVGCGGKGSMWEGFIGVDLHPVPKKLRKENTRYIQMDFTHAVQLPWPDDTFDEIICFHVIEHMSSIEGEILMARIYRLLKPGCKAYVVCPDIDIFAKKLLEKDHSFWNKTYPKNGKPMWEGKTIAEKFSFQINDGRTWGHKTGYNIDRLIFTAKTGGFQKIEVMQKGHRYHCDPSRTDHECGIICEK